MIELSQTIKIQNGVQMKMICSYENVSKRRANKYTLAVTMISLICVAMTNG